MRKDFIPLVIVGLILVLLTITLWGAFHVPGGTKVISAAGMHIDELIYFDPATGDIAKSVIPKEAITPFEKEMVVGLGLTPDHRKAIALFKFENGVLIGREPREVILPSMKEYLKGEAGEVISQFLESPPVIPK